MNWISPVVNRDITSTLNAPDWNRIGNNIIYLGKRFGMDLSGFGGSEAGLEPKTDWTVYGIPTEADTGYLLSLLTRLKNSLDVVPDGLPDVPEFFFLYYTNINDIETFLLKIYENCLGTSHAEMSTYTHAQLGVYTYKQLRNTQIGG